MVAYLVAGCSLLSEPATPTARLYPYATEPVFDLERMDVVPHVVAPEATVELRFRRDDRRSPAFVIERWTPGGWHWEWSGYSDPPADPLLWSVETHIRDSGGAFDAGPMVAADGPQPIPLPPELGDGYYRVCTPVADPVLCADFDVSESDG